MARVVSKKPKNPNLQVVEMELKKSEVFSIYRAVRGLLPDLVSVPANWMTFSGRNFRYLRGVVSERDAIIKQMDSFKEEIEAEKKRANELIKEMKAEGHQITPEIGYEIEKTLSMEFSETREAEKKVNKEIEKWGEELVTVKVALLPSDFDMNLKLAEKEDPSQLVNYCNWVEFIRAEEDEA